MYSSHGDPSQTIGTSGCGPTSAAMAVSTLTGKTILPTEAATFAVKNGFRTYDDGTAWSFFESFSSLYDLECIQTGSLDAAKGALRSGALVVATMKPGHFTGGGHYILLVGISADATMIDVFDPNQDNKKYGRDGLVNQGTRDDGKVSAKDTVFKAEAKQYWIFNIKPVKAVKEEEEPMTEVEKKDFEALQSTVKEQAERIASLEALVPAPAWFVKEFGSANLNGKISEPKLTGEGWRVLAIALRANKK